MNSLTSQPIQRKRHAFSLVELIIALGIVAIGICSVMSLFQIGATNTRDAAMESYAANAAAQILNYVDFTVRGLSSNNWGNKIPNIPTSKTSESDALVTNLDDKDNWQGMDSSTNAFASTFKNAFYQYGTSSSSNSPFYQVITHRCQDSENPFEHLDLIEFRAICNIWFESIDSNSGTLYVEVSWPAEISYTARRKAVYSLDITR